MSLAATFAETDVPALALKNVSRFFPIGGGFFGGGRLLTAVDDISLEVKRGEVLAIVGESGCGKTTLSRIMLGLQRPSRGEILIGGAPLASVDRKSLARRLQPVFQDPYSSLNPRKTVGSIIRAPLDIHAIGTPSKREARVLETMQAVGLPRRLEHSYPAQLSGGQRQRVAIARALVLNPEIVVCDEPTSALDVSVQAQILNLLKDLRDALDLTYVFISHDLSVVRYMANRVAVMYAGRIVEIGPAAEIFDRPHHPYTRMLLASVLTTEPGLGLPDPGSAANADAPRNGDGCAFAPRCPAAFARCQTEPAPQRRLRETMFECHVEPDDAGSAVV